MKRGVPRTPLASLCAAQHEEHEGRKARKARELRPACDQAGRGDDGHDQKSFC